MIKHKYTIVVLIILVPIFFVIQNNKWGKEKKISDGLIANGIKFSGIITDLKMSRNHEFGIIELRVIKSDTSKFLPSINERMFPYAINDSIAEVYDSVTYVLKKGDSVEVDSNEKVIKFFHKNEELYHSDITIITEKVDIDFVLKESKLYRAKLKF